MCSWTVEILAVHVSSYTMWPQKRGGMDREWKTGVTAHLDLDRNAEKELSCEYNLIMPLALHTSMALFMILTIAIEGLPISAARKGNKLLLPLSLIHI